MVYRPPPPLVSPLHLSEHWAVTGGDPRVAANIRARSQYIGQLSLSLSLSANKVILSHCRLGLAYRSPEVSMRTTFSTLALHWWMYSRRIHSSDDSLIDF